MTVSLLDYLDYPTIKPIKENAYKSVTREVQYLDSIIPTIQKHKAGIKDDLNNGNFGINTSALTNGLLNTKEEIISGCISHFKKELPSIYVNSNLLTKAGMHMKPFDGRTFVNFMKKQYTDVDLITLEQWRYSIIDEMVPCGAQGGEWTTWDKRTEENIKDINSAGIELRFYGRHFDNETLLNTVVKFAKFVFGAQQSNLSQLAGIEIPYKDMEAGKAYSTAELKSIRFFQGDKHRLKLGFKSPEMRQAFKTALFTPTWKLLGREEPGEPELKDACDICIFNGVSCMQCNDYDHWKGSCLYCQKNEIYPTYNNLDCDNCKTGRKDNFTPLAKVQNITGIMKEDGYYHHVWKARPPTKTHMLKVHCFGWGGLYKHYISRNYPAPVCVNCRACITQTQGEDINQICKSERAGKHGDKYYYVYNWR